MTRAQKDTKFRTLNKEVYHIAECGTFDDLVNFRNKFYAAIKNNELFKRDIKILEKADLYTERSVMRRAS